MKSARITRLLFLSLALMLAMFLTACGPSNTVRLLSPAPAVNPVLPAPNAPRVTVVPFTDNRQDTTNLGVRRDGSAFVASDDLAQWVSRGLADELRRQGVAAAEIVGVLARLAGLRPDMRPLAAADLLADFRLERLPRQDVCLRDLPCVPDWLRPLCLPC